MKKALLLPAIAAVVIYSLPGCKKEVPVKKTAVATEEAPFKQVNVACPSPPTVLGTFTTTGPKLELARSVTLRPDGAVNVQGTFYGQVDFQPGAGVHNLTAPTADSENLFSVTYDTNGNVRSATNRAPDDKDYYPRDAEGNMIRGGFEKNPGGTGNLAYRSILIKYNPAGVLLWKRYLAYASVEMAGSYASSIAFDNNGRIYAATPDNEIQAFSPTGNFLGKGFYGDARVKIQFDKDNNMYLIGFDSGSIKKVSRAGALLWTVRFEPSTQYGPNLAGLAADNAGNVYIAGSIGQTSDLDPGPGVYKAVLSLGGARDLFVVKLNASGNFVWALQSQALSSSAAAMEPQDIKIGDNQRDIYIVGSLRGRVMFNNLQSTITQSNGTKSGAFIMVARQCI